MDSDSFIGLELWYYELEGLFSWFIGLVIRNLSAIASLFYSLILIFWAWFLNDCSTDDKFLGFLFEFAWFVDLIWVWFLNLVPFFFISYSSSSKIGFLFGEMRILFKFWLWWRLYLILIFRALIFHHMLIFS